MPAVRLVLTARFDMRFDMTFSLALALLRNRVGRHARIFAATNRYLPILLIDILFALP